MPSLFTDVEDAQKHLTAPDTDEDDYAYRPNWLVDALSVSNWVRGMCQDALGWDPFEWPIRAITGNWAAYHTCSVVWYQVAAAAHDMSVDLHRAAVDLKVVWRGNAADGAQEFLLEFATAVESVSSACSFYGSRYSDASEAARQTFEAISDPANDLVDAVLLAVAEIFAGTASFETGIGPIIGYSAAAIEIGYVIMLYNTIAQALNTLLNTVSGIAGAMDVFLAERKTSMPDLPDAATPRLPG